MKELVKTKTVDFYETLGARSIVFYWRAVQPSEQKSFKVDVVASFPGTFTGPASRSYLYYTDEYKVWNSGIKVTVSAKN